MMTPLTRGSLSDELSKMPIVPADIKIPNKATKASPVEAMGSSPTADRKRKRDPNEPIVEGEAAAKRGKPATSGNANDAIVVDAGDGAIVLD